MPQDNKYSSINTLVWIFRLCAGFNKKLIAAIIVTGIFASVLPFVEQRYLSYLIDGLISALQTRTNTWQSILLLFMIFRVAKIFFMNVSRSVSNILDVRLQTNLHQIYLDKTANIDYPQFEDKGIANLISKVREEYQWRTRQVITETLEAFGDILSLITILVLLLPRYWVIALLLVVGEIPGLFVDKRWQKIGWDNFNRFNEKTRPFWDIHYQLSDKRYISELKVNRATDWLKNKFISAQKEWADVRVATRKSRFLPDTLASLFSTGLSVFCMLIVIQDIYVGLLTVGLFTFYFNIIRNTGDFIGSVLNRYISITEQLLYVREFRRLIELPKLLESGQTQPIKGKTPQIEFRNVSFKYPNTDKYVFKNLNLVIDPTEELAIVGPNGAGKSTLVKLICRFYHPTSGQILIDGIDLRDINQDAWYQQLSLLTQEFNVYPNLNLRDNVMIGDLNNTSKTSIINSLKKSEAYSFVKKYPRGLDTPMSQRFGGEEPSWGQWQKIAIARVFHRNSPIMILDEPTASIDAVAESKIFSRLYKEVKDKTLIIISHRFSTVRNAQRIIVIDQGQIVEQGSHEELLKRQGLYAKSFHLQASGYH